jgi:hypothetical protein
MVHCTVPETTWHTYSALASCTASSTTCVLLLLHLAGRAGGPLTGYLAPEQGVTSGTSGMSPGATPELPPAGTTAPGAAQLGGEGADGDAGRGEKRVTFASLPAGEWGGGGLWGGAAVAQEWPASRCWSAEVVAHLQEVACSQCMLLECINLSQVVWLCVVGSCFQQAIHVMCRRQQL